jgi:hypothetical protein
MTTLLVSKNNHIENDHPSVNYSLTDSVLRCRNDSGRTYKTLLAFTLPSRQFVRSAVLNIYRIASGTTRTLPVNRILRDDWSEDESSWNYYKWSSESWGTAGCANTTSDLSTTHQGTLSAAQGWCTVNVADLWNDAIAAGQTYLNLLLGLTDTGEVTFYKKTHATLHPYIDFAMCDSNSFFKLMGSRLPKTMASIYPLAQSDTYVKATSKVSTSYWPYFATDPAKSLTGEPNGVSWLSALYTITNQRIHFDLGVQKLINQIRYENFHNTGLMTNSDIKDFTFWGSNSGTAFADLVYSHDTNWTQIGTSQSSFDRHADSDTSDPKLIQLNSAEIFRYYAVKIANNYGNTNYMGVRRLELQSDYY